MANHHRVWEMDDASQPKLPHAKEDDPEDVSWALSTAEAMWGRGDRADALKWVRKAAEAASDAGADARALELAKAAAELVVPATPSPPTVEPDPSVASPPPLKKSDSKKPGAPRPLNTSGAPAPRASQTNVAQPVKKPSLTTTKVSAGKPQPPKPLSKPPESVEPVTVSPADRTPVPEAVEPKPKETLPEWESARPNQTEDSLTQTVALKGSEVPPEVVDGNWVERDSIDVGISLPPTTTHTRAPPAATEIPRGKVAEVGGQRLKQTQAVRVIVWKDANGVHIAPHGTLVSAITLDAMLVAMDEHADLGAWLVAAKGRE